VDIDSETITSVKIYHRTYQLRTGGDVEYLEELARHVDEQMLRISEETPTVDTLKIAILAALNIADEYFSTKKRLEVSEDQVCRKSTEVVELLESHLSRESSRQ
jgi:cell division protein ZapA